MKTLFTLLLTCLFIVSTAAAKYSGGTGEPNDPYQIATAADLIALGETPEDYDKHFVLTADIDLDPNLPGRKVFDKAVIAPASSITAYPYVVGAPFTGIFDGNGHTILHLRIQGKDYLGLFGFLSGGEIRDIGVVDAEITGTGRYIGGLAGYNRGRIAASYSSGSVGGLETVGGLVGFNSGDVVASYSSASVRGGDHAGGLVGWNGENIVASHSTGSVSGSTDVGGLVGLNTGSILASYSAGSSGGTTSVGGLVGANSNRDCSGSVKQCYSTGPVTGDYAVGGLVGYGPVGVGEGRIWLSYSTGAVTGNSFVGGLVGIMGCNRVLQCYSTGAVVGTDHVGGLVASGWAEGVRKSFWDIQASGQATSAGGMGRITAEMQGPNSFMAAGWDFVGQPDGPRDTWAEPAGGGYPVLSWQLPDKSDLPTFSGGTGEPEDPYMISTPMDLNKIACNSRLMGAHFELICDVDLADTDFFVIGDELCPFVGSFDGDGHTIAHLTIDANGPAGLFGRLAYPAEVKDLGVVDVSITGVSAGGLVGINDGGTVARCYSTGAVTGTGWGAGGLMGENYGNLMDSYSIGVVNGTSYVGGLVGTNGDLWTGNDTRSGYITRCYSSCLVDGPWAAGLGGLCGAAGGSSIDSFWDTQTSRQTTSDGGTAKSTAEMQTAKTFLDAGWDFVGETANGTEDIWWILEAEDYPRLWWEAPAIDD